MSRYTVDVDYKDDCITVTDEKEELTTSFGSEIILAPAEEAEIVINELNKKEVIIKVLYDALLVHEDEQDIDYWIESALEDCLE